MVLMSMGSSLVKNYFNLQISGLKFEPSWHNNVCEIPHLLCNLDYRSYFKKIEKKLPI